MDWYLAEKFGDRFVEDLKIALGEDYSKFNKNLFLKTHKMIMETGGWYGLTALNDVSVEEMELILELKRDLRKGKVSPYTYKKNLYDGKDHCVKGLKYEDYTELIKTAEDIGDIAWRNELLKMECGIK